MNGDATSAVFDIGVMLLQQYLTLEWCGLSYVTYLLCLLSCQHYNLWVQFIALITVLWVTGGVWKCIWLKLLPYIRKCLHRVS